jgi:ssDNA-binding Zn-finger/Zn-ribbon topoisomerase 1
MIKKTAKVEKCPKCGEIMIVIYGRGFDYDRLICGNKYCYYEIELDVTTIPSEETDKKIKEMEN